MPANVSEWQKEHPWEPSPESYPQPVPIVAPSDLINPMLRAIDVADTQTPTCALTSSLRVAVKMLSESPACVLPVVDRGEPVGVLTGRQVAAALANAGADFFTLPLDEVMSRDFGRLRLDATLDRLFDACSEWGALVLGDDGSFRGAIYWRYLPGKLSERALGRLLSRSLGGGAPAEVAP